MSNHRKKNKILITGVAGFVGKALALSLAKYGHDLVLAARDKNFRFPKGKIYIGDLSDPDYCKKILKGVDVVYYLAGYKKNLAFHVGKPFEFVLGNIRPLLTFLQALKSSSAETLVYLSSVLADFSDNQNIDGYALGKYINELLLKSFQKESKVKVKIVRSAPVYGPGDNFDPKVANFIPAIISRIYAAKDELIVWGKGKRKMQFIYIDDLIDNLIRARTVKGDHFVCGNPQIISINDIVKKIIKFSGKNLTLKHDLSKPDKPTKLIKFKNIVEPKTRIDEGLRSTIDYKKNNG